MVINETASTVPEITKYDDETIVMPNVDGYTITGADETVEVESRIVVNKSDQLNNHTFSDFELDTNTNNAAINLTDGHNSQSTFDNLVITS